jgi:hypothetical protein
LGFSEKTASKFDETLDLYREFWRNIAKFPLQGVELTMYSDAVLIVSESLAAILQAVQTLWFIILQHNLMIRGGIAKGKYWQTRNGNSLLVVSDALVRAVKLEKMVGVPAVVVADDINIPEEFWIQRFIYGPLGTAVLHFRDRTIVNPFNRYWLKSAGLRAVSLMQESPRHTDKYLWFLALHDAVLTQADLVPPNVLTRLIENKIIGRVS